MVGAELTESETALRVFLAAGGLILLGILFLVLTIWWWRSTKPESPALGPLEVMSERKWFTAAESERRRLLETNRPAGAIATRVAPEPVDLSQLAREAPSSFDDLKDPYEAPAARTVDPEAAELASSSSARAAAGTAVPAEAVNQAGNESAVEAAASNDSGVESAVVAVGDGAAGLVSDEGDASSSNGVKLEGPEGPEGPEGRDDRDHRDDAEPAADEASPADATVAMSRDETTAMPSPGRPSFVPHAGA